VSAALLVRHPPGYEPERRYAYAVTLSELLGLETELVAEDRPDVEITLADGSSDVRLAVADVLFSTPRGQWLTAASLPPRPLERVGLAQLGLQLHPVVDPLPLLYGQGRLEVAPGGSGSRLQIDVFGGLFFLLSRYEELVFGQRDLHDRYSAAGSLAGEEGLLDRPLANEYVEVLWAVLSRLWPRLERRPRRFTLRVSHDVDLPLCRVPLAHARRQALRDLRREHAPLVAARRVATAALGSRLSPEHDLYNTFDFLMRESEALGLRAAFYFFAGNTAGDIDGDYRLDEPWIRRLLREIHDRGHEIGLHASYGTYRDADAIRTEFEALKTACVAIGVEQEAWGGRQHYLRWANPETWQAWDDAGLAYDSTLGFADHAGFRSGICSEYPVFNLRARRALRLRERPLVVMDASLLEYQRLSLEAAAEEILRLQTIVQRFGGDLTLLWHNDRVLSRRARRAFSRSLSAVGGEPATTVRRT